MITAFPPHVRANSSSLIVYRGAPLVAVEWDITGSGTLTPITTATDAGGRATARYTLGTIGEWVTITIYAGTA